MSLRGKSVKNKSPDQATVDRWNDFGLRGILGEGPNFSFEISADFRDRFNWLVERFGKTFEPEVVVNDSLDSMKGIRQEGSKIYMPIPTFLKSIELTKRQRAADKLPVQT